MSRWWKAMQRARERTQRRVKTLVAYIEAHPGVTTKTDPDLARLDRLIGEGKNTLDAIHDNRARWGA